MGNFLSAPCVYEPRDKEFCPFIYGLVDPLEPRHVRYVGMASARASRPYQHATDAHREDKHSHLLHWIRSLQSDGREPLVLVLEELPQTSSRLFIGEIEKIYISSLREIGHRLTNVAEGGTGGNVGNYQHSKESRVNSAITLRRYFADPKNRAAIAERTARQGQTLRLKYASHPEMRQALSESKKGKQLRLGAILSEKTKAVLSEGMHRYYDDPENQAAIADRNARRAQTKANRPKIVMSKESNEARSKSLTGRTFSASHRAAISAAMKRRRGTNGS